MLQKVDDVDAIIEAVPYLMDPAQLVQSLSNLARSAAADCRPWQTAASTANVVGACRSSGYLFVDLYRFITNWATLVFLLFVVCAVGKVMFASCNPFLQLVPAPIQCFPLICAAASGCLMMFHRWFPNQDPFEMLQKNPKMLVNIEEADLEADPLYGEITTAG
jgi:hypothetical protein